MALMTAKKVVVPPRTVEQVPDYAKAAERLDGLNRRRADVAAELHKLGVDFQNESAEKVGIRLKAEALVNGTDTSAGLAATRAATALREEIAVLAEAVRMQESLVAEARRRAELAVCVGLLPEHRRIMGQVVKALHGLQDAMEAAAAFRDEFDRGRLQFLPPLVDLPVAFYGLTVPDLKEALSLWLKQAGDYPQL
jgi:hypothetical protein